MIVQKRRNHRTIVFSYASRRAPHVNGHFLFITIKIVSRLEAMAIERGNMYRKGVARERPITGIKDSFE